MSRTDIFLSCVDFSSSKMTLELFYLFTRVFKLLIRYLIYLGRKMHMRINSHYLLRGSAYLFFIYIFLAFTWEKCLKEGNSVSSLP